MKVRVEEASCPRSEIESALMPCTFIDLQRATPHVLLAAIWYGIPWVRCYLARIRPARRREHITAIQVQGNGRFEVDTNLFSVDAGSLRGF